MPSEPEPLLPDEEDDRPELVFALVVPVGTPKDRLVASLKSGLRQYGYQSEVIKLSSLLLDRDPDLASRTSGASEEKRVEALMEAGDRFCEDATNDAALVLEAVLDIGARRRSDGEATREHYKWAWIIDSLKRPGELDELRKIYGDHVVAIGCQASRQTRRRRMVDLIAPRSPSLPDEKIEAKIESLLSRDLDGAGPFRQNIVNTFSLSDVFINCDESEGCEREVQRLLDLLFGNPEAEKPTDMEFGMYLASGVAMRSPELGRQVGAAILQGGSITSVGVNSHPTEPSPGPTFRCLKGRFESARSRYRSTARAGRPPSPGCYRLARHEAGRVRCLASWRCPERFATFKPHGVSGARPCGDGGPSGGLIIRTTSAGADYLRHHLPLSRVCAASLARRTGCGLLGPLSQEPSGSHVWPRRRG